MADFEKIKSELAAAAVGAAAKAYAPYSHFCVGAALLTKGGKIYTGCNVENAAYPVGICAERTAFAKAISEGEREFTMIAVVGGTKDCYPCGLCRQFIREFAGEDFLVITAHTGENGEQILRTTSLSTLLPESFGPDNFEN